MNMMQPVRRIYQGPDVEMRDEAKGIYNCFIEDQSKFIEFDPDFGKPEFAPSFLKLIEDANAVQSNEQLSTGLKQLTEIVNDKMSLCRNKFQSSKYYIEKAFPNSPLIWDEFGYKAYEKTRNNQLRMKDFMRDFHTAAVKYSVKLIAANYTQEKIDEIDIIKQDFNQADENQEAFKRGRPTLTQDNLIILNNCYSMTAKVADVGKQIFENDFARRQRYILTTQPETTEEIQTPAVPQNPA